MTLKLQVANTRPIVGVEIIDDIVIDDRQRTAILDAFTMQADIIGTVRLAVSLFNMIGDHGLTGENALFIYPGNGGWLVRRLFAEFACRNHSPFRGVDISRVSANPVDIPSGIDRVVIIEDVIETGGTARTLRECIQSHDVEVTMACLLWHDRQSLTQHALSAMASFDRTLIAERITSDQSAPVHDVRSLTTLARKAAEPKNLRYSEGRERLFRERMGNVLDTHPWVRELGRTLGYRLDPCTA